MSVNTGVRSSGRADNKHGMKGLRFLFSLPTKAGSSTMAAYEKLLCSKSTDSLSPAGGKCQALLQAQEAQQWPVEQEPGAELTTPSHGRGSSCRSGLMGQSGSRAGQIRGKGNPGRAVMGA